MSYEFRLPDVGEGIAEAEIVRWLVQEGQRVERDQALVEIQTDKAVVEVPAPIAGVIVQRGGREGETLQVGDLLVTLQQSDDARPPATPATPAAAGAVPQGNGLPRKPQREARDVQTQTSAARSRETATGRPLATPAVRKLARELRVDLASVAGTGPAGRIGAEDVRAFASGASGAGLDIAGAGLRPAAASVSPGRAAPAEAAVQPGRSRAPLTGNGIEQSGSAEQVGFGASILSPQSPVLAEERVPLRGLRRRIAETMTQSWRTIPHITGQDEVDVTALVALREQLKPAAEATGLRLTYLPFIIKAAIAALKQYPIVNAYLDEAAGEIVYRRQHNIGIATATPDGLIVPVLHDAGRKSLRELQAEIGELSEQARTRRIGLAALQGGSFTITNFGSLGGWLGTPIIRPGEAGVLGIGRIQERPWAVEGRLEVRQIMALSFSADHRLIDGDVSTAFMRAVAGYLAEPLSLFLELA